MAARAVPSALRAEMETVGAMIDITCADLHGKDGLCPDCGELHRYAMLRLRHCRFGAEKPTCANCVVHCYNPGMREKIRGVMRHAGPKMLWRHPWLTLAHLWKGKMLKPRRDTKE